MKTILIATVMMAALCAILTPTQARRCKREVRYCNVTTEDGGFEFVEYGCGFVCCGQQLVAQNLTTECCGTEQAGTIYNSSAELCCSWPYGNEYKLYDLNNEGETCCGTDLFTQAMYRDSSCCGSYNRKPERFFWLTEMCCDGHRSYVGDTAYSMCCGTEGYDHRYSSCPCGAKGPVGKEIHQDVAECCRSEGGDYLTPYNRLLHGCCGNNGTVYDKQTEICCGGEVGKAADKMCCDDMLVPREDTLNGTRLACCIAADGSRQAYDLDEQVCCNGSLSKVPAGEEVQCCGGEVYVVAEEGDRCCAGVPHKSEDTVCCNGVVNAGDACCNGTGYYHGNQVCCDKSLSGENFKWASCCSVTAYDAYTQTCCGVSVRNNSMIPSGPGGELEVSHHSRCCGDWNNMTSLTAYDYFYEICCDQEISQLGELKMEHVQCCGKGPIDITADICCDGTPVALEFGEATGCCNKTAMNKTSGECCGESVIDPTTEKCCNDEARPLNGIAPDKAVCCGDGCIDGDSYYCCNGRQYSKGGSDGEQPPFDCPPPAGL